MDVIGIGFQHVIDSYFWYLPFASVRQCKYALDKTHIGADEWMAKHADLAEEHKTRPDASEQLKQGFKDWMSSYLFKEQRSIGGSRSEKHQGDHHIWTVGADYCMVARSSLPPTAMAGGKILLFNE